VDEQRLSGRQSGGDAVEHAVQAELETLVPGGRIIRVCLGMTLRSPEAAQQTGFIIFLPLTFISSAFVPIQGMPGWLQPIAEWNPMSALAAACRHLFGNPNPAASVDVWPMQHPELAVICWSVAMLVVFAPLAVHLYRRKALG
jgi:ABC-type multidrug transport system permease subunit